MFYAPLTGVVKPDVNISGNGGAAVPLASNWIILLIIFLVLVYIIIKRIHANKEKRKEFESLKLYIKDALEKGYSKESLMPLLIKKNWSEDLIDKCFDEIESHNFKNISKMS